MKNDINIEDILRQKRIRDNHKKPTTQSTIAQFQFKHCRYCKNKNSSLCEIRRTINNNYSCIYEENMYEKRNIK